jgi:hypothetical protein
MHSLHRVHEQIALWTGHVHLYANFNLRTTGQLRMKFGMGVVPGGPPSYCNFEYPKIGSIKTVDGEDCEMGHTGGALW